MKPTLLYQIETYMDDKRITKYQLAQKAGMSASWVYDVFNGHRPATHNTMLKFLIALGLDVEYVLTEKE
ncbi:Helix-turn-helix domain protein [Klebsiella quasipneumoniae]|uniref:helix-turn-helix domain-containing protein n=1 Tax=Klebsiella quasipneumoniae TaxID=1463165 RepID=UPI0005E95C7F|nr:helix-turn-helix transcriptional regulator [Klebsiella quasipneumoniae]CEL82314.1 Helix-turn-helix domain protein [Klebsiella quasipneumoniae]